MVAYRRSRKAERGIDSSGVWVAASNKICAERVNWCDDMLQLKVLRDYLDEGVLQ